MNWEEKGKELVDILLPVYKPEIERKLFKSIVSIIYNQLDIVDAERFLMSVYDNLPSHSVERTDMMAMAESIIGGEAKPNTGLKSLKKTIAINFNKSAATQTVEKVERILTVNTHKEHSQSYAIGENSWIKIDSLSNKVNHEFINYVKNEEMINTTPVLLCRPYNVIVHEDPLYEGKREFTITWITTNNTYFTVRRVGISEIKTQLADSGYVLNGKFADAAIVGAIQIFLDNGIADTKNEIEARGFYYSKSDNKLIVVDWDQYEVRKEDVEAALLLLDDLKNFFKGNEDKLATTIKHGLQVPFGFAKKQMGLPLEYLVPYIYHFGKGGSGKTTIAKIGLWLYNQPSVDVDDIGGTEFDTVPRIGEQLRKFTFGLLVNEPETALNKRSCAATLKTTAERTNSRQKFRGNRMEHILALATVVFASNVPLPNHEGLSRRFVQILYNYSEKKTDKEKEEFMTHFRLNDPENCEFNKLHHLGNFVVDLIQKDVSLLKKSWQDLGNFLIVKAYQFCGIPVPKWILGYTESVTDEDIDADEIEDIRLFLLSQINRNAPQIKLYSSDDGRPISQELFYQDEAKTSDDFEEKVWNVINEGLLGFAFTHQRSDGVREVCFTSGIKKIFNENGINCYSLSSTAELLGWKNTSVFVHGKARRCMSVNFREFLRFLYPMVSDDDSM